MNSWSTMWGGEGYCRLCARQDECGATVDAVMALHLSAVRAKFQEMRVHEAKLLICGCALLNSTIRGALENPNPQSTHVHRTHMLFFAQSSSCAV